MSWTSDVLVQVKWCGSSTSTKYQNTFYFKLFMNALQNSDVLWIKGNMILWNYKNRIIQNSD